MHFIGRSPSDRGVVVRLQAKLDHELLVTDEDRAILFESGAPLVDLGPGRHTLSATRIPALRVAGDLSGVQVFLVRAVASPVPVKGVTQPIPVAPGVIGRVQIDGSCQLQVTDPRRLLATLVGSDPGAELAEAAERAVRQAVTLSLTGATAPPPELFATPPPAFLEAVRASAAETLAPQGATVTAVALALRLDDDARSELARTRPPTGAAAQVVPAQAAIAPLSARELAEVPTAPAGSCPRCGSPLTGARFCAGCGAPAPGGGCSVCGAPLAAGARFCSTCGKPVTLGPRRCGCGAELAVNAKFCSSCGAKA
jgi:hypothetical protein